MKAALALSLLLLPALLLAPRAHAGGLLGALYDTCLGTLGEPVSYARLPTPSPGAEVYAFRQRGWVVTVFFWKHQAHLVVYEKQANASILPAETDAILRSYGDTLPWTRKVTGQCLRRDGKTQARISPAEVAIFSTEFGRANARYDRP